MVTKKVLLAVMTLTATTLVGCSDEPGAKTRLGGSAGHGLEVCHNCTLINPQLDTIAYSKASDCSEDQLYLESDLMSVHPAFRLPRKENTDAQIPKSCVAFAMEIFPDIESMYSKCETINSRPVAGAKKPCMTSQYVNSVYNSFVDVMACLDINQKNFVPKLLNESGFHINALNSKGFDAGVGQITKAPLEDINSNHRFKRLMGRIKNGGSDACKRITQVEGVLEPAKSDSNNRCSVIKPGLNPLRNLIYTGLLTVRQKEIVEFYFDKHEIDQLMKAGGLANYNRQALIESLTILGYNAGGGTAVNYLKNYLEIRISNMSKSRRGHLTEDDFDFNTNIEKVLNKRSQLMANFKRAKEEGFNDNGIEALKRIENEADNYGIENMTFPEFLVHFQTVGSRGYNTFLAQNKRKIDEKYRGGECTPEKFLSL